jgi:spermidine synthase
MAARGWAILLMMASGFAGLGYQIVWTQQSAVWIGHEAPAMLAIVAAFFGGIALGAWWTGRRIDASPRPALWYALAEAAIGLWGLVLVLLMSPASEAMLALIGPQPGALRHWAIAFGGTFLLLLPATAAMGATLPAMERIVSGFGAGRAPVAMLYAANTLGALCGVIGAAFLLVPRLGFAATALICVALNLFCAVATPLSFQAQTTAATPAAGSDRAPLLTLFFTGLLGIGYEVLVVRVLSQVAENTVFTFAILLAVYLLGTALGAAGYARWVVTGPALVTRDRLLRLQTAACLLGVLALTLSQRFQSVLPPLMGEVLLAAVAFLPPTLVMGALFSHLATAARVAGAGLGTALGANTLGAALAPALFGVLLLPLLGSTLSLLLASAAYLVAASRRSWLALPQIATAGAAAAMLAWHPPLAAPGLAPDARLLSHVEGLAANVSVLEDGFGVATLHINNRQQEGSSATLYADARQALLPLLLHAEPRRALFLGLGTGATARSATLDPALQVDAVELLPEVVAASELFARLQQAGAQPRLNVLTADARRFIRSTGERYDIIVSDNFHPARSGSAALYTIEHFSAVRRKLAVGGIFCQWLPLHQLDRTTLRSIVHSYTTAFPRSWAVLATNSLETPVLGLLAQRDAGAFDLAAIRARLAAAGIADVSARFGFDDDLALLGSFVAGPRDLASFAQGAPLNTDDHPVVSYLAPRITYTPDSSPGERLMELLAGMRPEPGELFEHAADASWNRRLEAYWAARNQFLEAGRDVKPSQDVHIMLAQVRTPLLAVLQTSPDFRPAYQPLLMMARALGRSDAPAARELLAELDRLKPEWPGAREALAELLPAISP